MSITARKDNVIVGDCKTAEEGVEAGVADGDGKRHPGYPGWTHIGLTFKLTPKESLRVRQRVWCEPTNTYYFSAGECARKCPGGLGTTGMQICADADPLVEVTWQVTIAWKQTVRSYGLRWKPASEKEACQDEAIRWHDRIAAHEQQHYDDARDEIEKATRPAERRRRRLRQRSADGETPEELRRKLEGQLDDLEKDLNQHVKDTLEKINKRSDDFHTTAQGKEIAGPKCKRGC